jgi:6-phosphogluconolactonase
VQRPDHPRLTLTLPVLSAAKVVMFVVSGESKREPLRRLLAGADIPAARVRARQVIIIGDEAAAGRSA